jgi:YfiH family protein
MRLGPAEVRFTNRADGDQRLGDLGVEEGWTRLRQVHGAEVVVVEHPGQHAGAEADAAVTNLRGAMLAILTADCAPIALASADGVIGAVHAGWRGLVAGVVERTVEAMRALGANHIEAALGPCIHPECYEFGPSDLSAVANRLGYVVRGRTDSGRPSLNLPAAVRASLTRVGVALDYVDEGCTACSTDYFSHRARGEDERQAMVVWLP